MRLRIPVHPQLVQFTFVVRRMQQVHAAKGELLQPVHYLKRIFEQLLMFFGNLPIYLMNPLMRRDQQGLSISGLEACAGCIQAGEKKEGVTVCGLEYIIR